MRKIDYLSEINEHGYVGYQFEDSKRFASAKVQEDSKGKYFVSKKEKYYIDEIKQGSSTEEPPAKETKAKTPATYLYTGWNEDKTEYIHDEEREITVGMPCTFSVGSDLYPAHVSRISDSGKTVWIKRANYTADKEGGHDYFGSQKWIITPEPKAKEEKVTKRKYGQWKMSGSDYMGVGFGHARAYQDPHF